MLDHVGRRYSGAEDSYGCHGWSPGRHARWRFRHGSVRASRNRRMPSDPRVVACGGGGANPPSATDVPPPMRRRRGGPSPARRPTSAHAADHRGQLWPHPMAERPTLFADTVQPSSAMRSMMSVSPRMHPSAHVARPADRRSGADTADRAREHRRVPMRCRCLAGPTSNRVARRRRPPGWRRESRAANRDRFRDRAFISGTMTTRLPVPLHGHEDTTSCATSAMPPTTTTSITT